MPNTLQTSPPNELQHLDDDTAINSTLVLPGIKRQYKAERRRGLTVLVNDGVNFDQWHKEMTKPG
jgi:hypothetical protein